MLRLHVILFRLRSTPANRSFPFPSWWAATLRGAHGAVTPHSAADSTRQRPRGSRLTRDVTPLPSHSPCRQRPGARRGWTPRVSPAEAHTAWTATGRQRPRPRLHWPQNPQGLESHSTPRWGARCTAAPTERKGLQTAAGVRPESRSAQWRGRLCVSEESYFAETHGSWSSLELTTAIQEGRRQAQPGHCALSVCWLSAGQERARQARHYPLHVTTGDARRLGRLLPGGTGTRSRLSVGDRATRTQARTRPQHTVKPRTC